MYSTHTGTHTRIHVGLWIALKVTFHLSEMKPVSASSFPSGCTDEAYITSIAQPKHTMSTSCTIGYETESWRTFIVPCDGISHRVKRLFLLGAPVHYRQGYGLLLDRFFCHLAYNRSEFKANSGTSKTYPRYEYTPPATPPCLSMGHVIRHNICAMMHITPRAPSSAANTLTPTPACQCELTVELSTPTCRIIH